MDTFEIPNRHTDLLEALCQFIKGIKWRYWKVLSFSRSPASMLVQPTSMSLQAFGIPILWTAIFFQCNFDPPNIGIWRRLFQKKKKFKNGVFILTQFESGHLEIRVESYVPNFETYLKHFTISLQCISSNFHAIFHLEDIQISELLSKTNL